MLSVSIPDFRLQRLVSRKGFRLSVLRGLRSGIGIGLLLTGFAGLSTRLHAAEGVAPHPVAVIPQDSAGYLPSPETFKRHRGFFLTVFASIGLLLAGLVRLTVIWRTSIQERQRALQGEARLAALLDNVGSYVYIKDQHYRYRFGNRRVLELFGISQEELTGGDDSRFFAAETFEATRAVDRRVVEQGETVESIEVHAIRSDGSHRHYLTVKTPLRTGDGEITGLCGVSTDVTESMTVRALLQQWETRFSKIASRLPGVRFQADFRADDRSVRIPWVSENVTTLFGLSPAALATGFGPVLALIHPDDKDRLIESVQASIASLTPEVHECRIDRTDGETRWLRASWLFERTEGGLLTAYGFINDVTIEHARQDIAQELQYRLNKVALRVPGAIFQLERSPAGHLSMPYVSDGLTVILGGMTPHQLKDDASPFLALCHPEDRQGFRSSLAYALDHLHPWFHEFRIVYPDGDFRWLRGSASPEAQGNGAVTAYGFLTDITERQLAQRAIDELQNRLSRIAARLPGILFELEQYPDGHTLMPYASQGADTLFAVTDTALRCVNDAAFARVHPEDRPGVLASLHKSATGLQAWVTQFRVTPSGGRTRWLRVDAVPSPAGAAVIVWHGYASDITEEHLTGARLRETEEKLRNLYRLSPLGIALTDMAGHFMDFNPAVLNLFGYTENELKSLDYWDVTPREYEQQEASQLESIARSGAYGPYEKEYIRKDGGRVPVRLNGVIIQGQEDEAYIWSIIEDMTASRAILDELKRSNAELEQFAYAVSHDMRQPLRMISSYLQIIERVLTDSLDESTRAYMGYAVEGAKRMEQMILSLLEYSRVGRSSEAPDLIESRKPLEEALHYLGPDISACEGQVDISGNWPPIQARHDEMTRLFHNLIGNALKYHPENVTPVITVAARVVAANRLRVEVGDNGIGIDPTQVDRLFQVFSRLQPRVRYDGVGVGLALCRKIVEHHKGTIGVISEGEGKGSLFWFEMPIVRD